MINNPCILGPEFVLNGDPVIFDQEADFALVFDPVEDEALVQAYEWYLDGQLVQGQDEPVFFKQLSCGHHTIGVRVLTETGWSGIRKVAVQTCAVPVSVNLTGPSVVAEGATAAYQIIAGYFNGTTKDITSEYTFSAASAPGVSFAGNVLSAAANNTNNDSRKITVTASKSGSGMLTKQVTIIDTTPVTLAGVTLTGPASAKEGSSNSLYRATAVYSDGRRADKTLEAVFTLTGAAGTFVNNRLFVYPDETYGNRTATITASFGGETSEPLTITILDTTPLTVESLEVSGPATVNEGTATNKYTVKAHYSDGTVADRTNLATFRLSDPTKGTFANNWLYVPANTTHEPGDTPVDVIVSFGGEVVHKPIQIRNMTPVTLQSVVFTGPEGEIEEGGGPYTFTLTAYYSDGTEVDKSGEAVFSLSDPALGTFTGNQLTVNSNAGYGDKQQVVRVVWGNIVRELTITVKDTTPVTVVSLEIAGPLEVNEGDSAAYQVIASLSTGATEDITQEYTFMIEPGSSSFPDVGTFTGNILNVPINTASDDDDRTAIITAWKSGVASVTKTIHIRDTPITYPLLTIIAPPDTLREGGRYAFTLMATYSDGESIDCSAEAVFSFSLPNLGEFVGNELIIFSHTIFPTWDATITASFDGKTETLHTTIIDDGPKGLLSLSMRDIGIIYEGREYSFSLITHYGNGMSLESGSAYPNTFSLSDPTLGTFNYSTLTIHPNIISADTDTMVVANIEGKTISIPITIKNVSSPAISGIISRTENSQIIEGGGPYEFILTVQYANGTYENRTADAVFATEGGFNGKFNGNLLTVDYFSYEYDTERTVYVTATLYDVIYKLSVPIKNRPGLSVDTLSLSYVGDGYFEEGGGPYDFKLIAHFNNGANVDVSTQSVFRLFDFFVYGEFAERPGNQMILYANTIDEDIVTSVTASYRNIQTSPLAITIRNAPATLVSLTLTGPDTVNRQPEGIPYTVIANYSDGSNLDVSEDAIFNLFENASGRVVFNRNKLIVSYHSSSEPIYTRLLVSYRRVTAHMVIKIVYTDL